MASVISQIRIRLATFTSAVHWVVGSSIFLLIGLVLGPILPEKQARVVGQWLIRTAFRTYVVHLRWLRIAECKFVGLERLSAEKGPFVLAPNHPAIWDCVFVLAAVPSLTCVLKSALLKNPFTMGAARLARFIPNDPPGEMVKGCVRAVRAGHSLLLFPEGTRTRRKECLLNEFKGGVAIVARQTGVPVYPLFIKTDNEFGMKGRRIWHVDTVTTHITMTVGEPLRCGEQESAHEFLERLRGEHIRALSTPP
jgi:1-acyl-sn-glycerol-3-phosphate acyltransferase